MVNLTKAVKAKAVAIRTKVFEIQDESAGKIAKVNREKKDRVDAQVAELVKLGFDEAGARKWLKASRHIQNAMLVRKGIEDQDILDSFDELVVCSGDAQLDLFGLDDDDADDDGADESEGDRVAAH